MQPDNRALEPLARIAETLIAVHGPIRSRPV
jgi:hypothetical protein